MVSLLGSSFIQLIQVIQLGIQAHRVSHRESTIEAGMTRLVAFLPHGAIDFQAQVASIDRWNVKPARNMRSSLGEPSAVTYDSDAKVERKGAI